LARLIQSSRLLVDEANANYGQVTQLIDQAGPFLDAQIRSGDDIKSLAEGLARFTGEVANADPQVRSVLQNVPGTTDAANTTFQGIRPTFPVLAANLANFGRIGVIYRKSLEQALVIFPAVVCRPTRAASWTSRSTYRTRRRARLASSRRRRSGHRPTPRCVSCRPTCTARQHKTIRPWCAARATTLARSSLASGHPRFSSAATRRDTCRSAATRGAVRPCRMGHRSRIRG